MLFIRMPFLRIPQERHICLPHLVPHDLEHPARVSISLNDYCLQNKKFKYSIYVVQYLYCQDLENMSLDELTKLTCDGKKLKLYK